MKKEIALTLDKEIWDQIKIKADKMLISANTYVKILVGKDLNAENAKN